MSKLPRPDPNLADPPGPAAPVSDDGAEIGIHILMGLNSFSIAAREEIENAPHGEEIDLGVPLPGN